MQSLELNPRFSNRLEHSTSPYLRQHAHNPVFWYPWDNEALNRAQMENKPILLSIGYSTCYWCHVMEREVFENPSIAALMNRCFINIKVDREEHPQIDEIYMAARQLLTGSGGWPNNVFLTPDLKPFHAGGTYSPNDTPDKSSFPRLLEWLNYSWITQERDVREKADNIFEAMQQHLVFRVQKRTNALDVGAQAGKLFDLLKQYYDAGSGGFFQAPKFPHETYLSFLLAYHEQTGSQKALDMVTHTLGKMASGGIYDHVGCGFHRYAIDKEWYVPHFEKMLYNQALLARVYTDAARITGSPYFADIARSVLDFVSGPMTDGNGGFYAAIDAETNGVEGAYYAWAPEELQRLLTQQETMFITNFYALADIPEFPGHKHVDGQVILAREPLDKAAEKRNIPYVQLAAMTGGIMNKLLLERNRRTAPGLDDKIITGWNGLMIDAFAYAGKVFGKPAYIERARKAADFILEKMIDNDSSLKRIYAGTRAQLDATFEDYAYLIKGMITLYQATSDQSLLEVIDSLIERADRIFGDTSGGYFQSASSERVLLRIKNGDDSALPNSNGIMLQNFAALAHITGKEEYRKKATALAEYFLDGNDRILLEFTSMIQGALGIEGKKIPLPSEFTAQSAPELPTDDNQAVTVTHSLFPADAGPGDTCELIITLDIKDGWHINAHEVTDPFLMPTQIRVQGDHIQVAGMVFPAPLKKTRSSDTIPLYIYEGMVNITARIRISPEASDRGIIRAMVSFQPCNENSCFPSRNITIQIPA